MALTEPKRQTFKSQYGRRGITVSGYCPTRSITHKLARTHVRTTASEVEEIIRKAVARQRKRPKGHEEWTTAAENEAVRFALWRHAENAAEYNFVMGGLAP